MHTVGRLHGSWSRQEKQRAKAGNRPGNQTPGPQRSKNGSGQCDIHEIERTEGIRRPPRDQEDSRQQPHIQEHKGRRRTLPDMSGSLQPQSRGEIGSSPNPDEEEDQAKR